MHVSFLLYSVSFSWKRSSQPATLISQPCTGRRPAAGRSPSRAGLLSRPEASGAFPSLLAMSHLAVAGLTLLLLCVSGTALTCGSPCRAPCLTPCPGRSRAGCCCGCSPCSSTWASTSSRRWPRGACRATSVGQGLRPSVAELLERVCLVLFGLRGPRGLCYIPPSFKFSHTPGSSLVLEHQDEQTRSVSSRDLGWQQGHVAARITMSAGSRGPSEVSEGLGGLPGSGF